MSEFEDVKKFEDMSIPERMRVHFQPKGTAPVVGLHLNDRFFHVDFINKCVDELEKIPMKVALGDQPSNLEKLAYTLLCDSAYIETK
jgi:hypothetical protein